MKVIGNVKQAFPDPLVVSYLQNLYNNAQKIQNFYERVWSDILAKAIEGSIKNKSLKNLSMNRS